MAFSRVPHGYGFTHGLLATGPTGMGKVSGFHTCRETIPGTAVSRVQYLYHVGY